MNPAAEAIQPFLDQLRGAFPELRGTDTQVVGLILNALEVVDPDSTSARIDRDVLIQQLTHTLTEMPGDEAYPDD